MAFLTHLHEDGDKVGLSVSRNVEDKSLGSRSLEVESEVVFGTDLAWDLQMGRKEGMEGRKKISKEGSKKRRK